MADERIENGKRYFRRKIDCAKHGEGVPAFRDWSDDSGDDTCIECYIDALMVIWDDGGEVDWEWTPEAMAERMAKRSPFMVHAESVAKVWREKMIEDISAYQGKSFFTPFMRGEDEQV